MLIKLFIFTYKSSKYKPSKMIDKNEKYITKFSYNKRWRLTLNNIDYTLFYDNQ